MARDTLVIVRPRDRVDQTRLALEGFSYTLHFEDVLSYHPTQISLPRFYDVQGVIITSVRALQALDSLPLDLLVSPLYVVGKASADRARTMGFQKLEVVTPTVEELQKYILENCKPCKGGFLYLRGDQVMADLARDLAPCGFSVCEHITYTTQRKTALSETIQNLIMQDHVRAVLFFSKASAAQFHNLIIENNFRNKLASISALCLSTSVLKCVQNLSWERTYAAKTPDLRAMAALVRTLPQIKAVTEGMIVNGDDTGSERTHSERRSDY